MSRSTVVWLSLISNVRQILWYYIILEKSEEITTDLESNSFQKRQSYAYDHQQGELTAPVILANKRNDALTPLIKKATLLRQKSKQDLFDLTKTAKQWLQTFLVFQTSDEEQGKKEWRVNVEIQTLVLLSPNCSYVYIHSGICRCINPNVFASSEYQHF